VPPFHCCRLKSTTKGGNHFVRAMSRPPKAISTRKYAVPSNLDLNRLLLDHPPHFKGKSRFRPDRVYQVLDAVYRAAIRKKIRSDAAFISIPSSYFRSVVAHYHEYTRWLEEAGVIEIDHRYMAMEGGRGISKGYRFTPDYRTAIKKDRVDGVEVKEPISTASLTIAIGDEDRIENTLTNPFFTFQQSNPSKSHIVINKDLSLPSPILAHYVRKTRGQVSEQVKRDTLGRLCVVLTRVTVEQGSVEQVWEQKEVDAIEENGRALCLLDVMDRAFRITISPLTGRLYTPITQMRREARRSLLLDGSADLAMVDVRTCHPFLLIHVAGQVRQQNPRIISRKRIEEWADTALNEDLYELLIWAREQYDGCRVTREAMKEDVQRIFNGPVHRARNSRPFITKRIFRAIFPQINRVINYVKQKPLPDYRRLSRVLQGVESEVMLWRVCPRLLREGIEPLTVHDAVIVPTAAASRATEIIREEFGGLVGLPPNVKVTQLRSADDLHSA
jgi:hypothetical protein